MNKKRVPLVSNQRHPAKELRKKYPQKKGEPRKTVVLVIAAAK